MHIVGTAGHVDHGKSALVRALTGTDPDRWLEEQRRGMTLDLGFAQLSYPDGVEAGMVDVPGHDRFLHNMLAGAAGMEIVLLVVAANAGVKPQTLEHLAILRYLNVRRTLVVLSKSDTVGAAEREPIEAELRANLRGTIAADAPIYPVSTLTGAGLGALRSAIHAALAALPERAPHAPVYLPIDRVFALAGHGTIVTGTLMQGRIKLGDSLALAPLGRVVRVRSLQVFGRKRDLVTGGTRVAINLPGVETAEIARGAVLASPQFPAAMQLNVRFTPLPGAVALLRRRTPVRAYIGAAELLGTLVFDTAPTAAQEVEARLLLRSPTIAVPGAPFVVRRISPMTVLGGGTLAATSASANEPPGEAHDDRDQRAVLAQLRLAGFVGSASAQLGAAANISEERVGTVLGELVADGRARILAKPHAYVDGELADELVQRAIERLAARQHERPWLMGLTSIALANALALPETVLVRVLAVAAETGRVAYRGGYYATPDFSPRLSPEQQAFFDSAFAPIGGVRAPVGYEQLRATMRASSVTDIVAAFETLLAGGALAKVGDFLYRGAQIRTIRAQLESALRANGPITVAQFRDVTGTSRKYAVPLLEFFDATGVTIRSGDTRVLRANPAKPRA